MKFSGIVEQGEGQASRIAVPTANIKDLSVSPDPGIYASLIKLHGTMYKGVAYIGKAWLLQGAPERMEFHLFDYDGPAFYGEPIEVELKQFIRKPIEFTSEQQASEQIDQDIKQAKELLNA